MSIRSRRSFNTSAFPLTVAVLVLGIGLVYTLGHVYLVPYLGFELDTWWRIYDVQESCEDAEINPDLVAWCEDTAARLLPGDQIAAITLPERGEQFTREQAASNLLLIPFHNLDRGDQILLTVNREGEQLEVSWPIQGGTLPMQLVRLGGSLLFLPFWLAGTAVLLFFRPRDLCWYLLVAFNYLTGIWLVVGIVSSYRIFGSSLLVILLSWLLIPVYLHFHLLVPSPLISRRSQRWFYLVYVIALVMALLSILGLIPRNSYYFGLLIGMGGSLVLLLFRALHRTSSPNRSATNLMLTGLAIAVLPSLLTLISLAQGDSGSTGGAIIILVLSALPALPFFYTYALYKHRLGNMEVRANRALAIYGFAVIYATVFVLLFVLFYRQPESNAQALGAALAASSICMLTALILWEPAKRTLNRIAYGTVYEPDQLVRHFANEISRTLNREHLARLLADQVMPSLLVRQSALFWLTDVHEPLIYSDDVEEQTIRRTPAEVTRLLESSGRFLTGEETPDAPFDWVRLVVPIEVDGQTIGVWLLGRRDPDDFYPQSDIDLLSTLSNQIAVALETIRLFEISQQHALQLERANFELRRADRLKGDLLRNITHELRTPLAAVYGYSELLSLGEGGTLSDEQQEMVQIVVNSAQDLIRMVDDILTLQQSRLNPGESQLVDIRQVAANSIRRAQVLADKDNIWRDRPHKIILHQEDQPLCIWADPMQVGQIFDNLLSNAVKFSPDGGNVTVRLWAGEHTFGAPASKSSTNGTNRKQTESLHRPAVFISLRDEGIGIAPEELDNIWLEFYQIDGSATRRFGGTGLGLALVKDIVEAHSGEIWVESRVGKGSTFTIALPSHIPVETAEPVPSMTQDSTTF